MAADTVVHSVIVNELLNPDNYEHWRVRVRTYLLAKGLWNLVEDENAATEPSRGKAKKEAWNKINAEALHAIHICCGNHAFSLIEDITSAKEAWDTLEEKLSSNGTCIDRSLFSYLMLQGLSNYLLQSFQVVVS